MGVHYTWILTVPNYAYWPVPVTSKWKTDLGLGPSWVPIVAPDPDSLTHTLSYCMLQIGPSQEGNSTRGYPDIRWHQMGDSVRGPTIPRSFMAVTVDLRDDDYLPIGGWVQQIICLYRGSVQQIICLYRGSVQQIICLYRGQYSRLSVCRGSVQQITCLYRGSVQKIICLYRGSVQQIICL